MVILTEEMVIARTKQSNLSTITKLNCWGSQLSDVSLLRKMPNVTVLSLSVNGISSLADFQFCKKLQELFIRKNNVQHLNQVCYLQELKDLKLLWLAENPCAVDDEGYRLSVIRALPQLSKLDNEPIVGNEFDQAKRHGRMLIHPEQQEEYYSDPEDAEDDTKYSPNQESNERRGSVRLSFRPTEREFESYSPEPQYQRQREFVQNLQNHEEEPVDPQNLTSSVTRISYHPIPRSQTADGELSCTNDWRRNSRVCQGNCSRRSSERRPNILNAILCLIKELDYSNLEIVEMAVRSRMDELEG